MDEGQNQQRRKALRRFLDRVIVGRQGGSLNAWCKRAAVSESTVRGFLASRTESLNDKTYQKLAAAAGVTVPELLGEMPGQREVPLVGYVGAGAQVHPFDDYGKGDGLLMVDAPPDVKESVVALEVKGDSMFPAYRDGDRLYYARDYSFDEAACLNNECVVKITDGATLVKVLLRGSQPGFFNLISYNAPPIENVRLDWAAPIQWVDKRRRMRALTGAA